MTDDIPYDDFCKIRVGFKNFPDNSFFELMGKESNNIKGTITINDLSTAKIRAKYQFSVARISGLTTADATNYDRDIDFNVELNCKQININGVPIDLRIFTKK